MSASNSGVGFLVLHSIACSKRRRDTTSSDDFELQSRQGWRAPLAPLGRWLGGKPAKEFIDSGYDLKKLIPKFVKQNELVRLKGDYVQPIAADFETNFVIVLRGYLYSKYFSDLDKIYEFGCGTGHNLVSLASLFPEKKLYGYDWTESSTRILALLRDKKHMNIEGGRFNLFSPDKDLHIEPGAGVFTIGTLEQTGTNFMPFLEWLLDKPFSICVNIETIYELYDQNNLLDVFGCLVS